MRIDKSVPYILLLFSAIAAPLFAQDNSAAGIGIEADYPPFSYRNDAGEPEGFTVDLVRAIAEIADLEVVIVLEEWSEVRSNLLNGDIDAIAGMYRSPERDRFFDFTQSFLTVTHVAFHRGETAAIESLDDLAGRRVIVMDHDIMHDRLVSQGPAVELSTASSISQALVDLQAGQSDYALLARIPARYYIDELGISELRESGFDLLVGEYAMAVPEGNVVLRGRLQDALYLLEESGRLGELREKWFNRYRSEPRSLWYRIWAARAIFLPLLATLTAVLLWVALLRKQVSNRTKLLEAEVANGIDSQKRLDHLNRVLSAMRKINRLFTSSSDDPHLLGKVCRTLVEERGYRRAFLVLTDEDHHATATYRAGYGDRFAPLESMLFSGGLPGCAQRALDSANPVLVDRVAGDCEDCPVSQLYDGEQAMAAALRHRGRTFGVVSVAISESSAGEKEEYNLFAELASDIAFAVDEQHLARTSQALSDSLRFHSHLLESISDRVVAADLKGRVTYANGSALGYIGVDADRLLGRHVSAIAPAAIRGALRNLLAETLERERWNGHIELPRPDGTQEVFDVRTEKLYGGTGKATGMVAIGRDISDEMQVQSRLEGALQEKTTLLRELHHRTKNNMQVVASMLALRRLASPSDDNDNQFTAEQIKEIEAKIQSMALVHTKLYQSGDLSRIDLKEYLEELCVLILSTMGAEDRIGLTMDLESVGGLVDTAVPLGLVVNEILTNAAKHAFPNARDGQVRIHMRAVDGEKLLLEIADNGIGMAEESFLGSPKSLGIQTIRNIVQMQLNGKVEVYNNHGTTWRVSVANPQKSSRV